MARLRLIGRKTLALPLGILLGTVLAVVVPGAPAGAQGAGQWQFTGSMATGHSNWYNTGFAQLLDGRVLAISGSNGPGSLTLTAEIYDPGTGQWTPAGSLNDARYAFGQPSVLPDGDVLVAGGHDVNVVDYATAELYDPAANQWTFTGSLNQARRYPVQVELANGEVLVATGSFGPPTCTRYLSSAELYNPATGQWTYTGSALVPRESATAIRLADGRVLLAGGYNGGGSACTDTDPVDTEIYDPSTGQWSFAGNLPHGWLGGAMVLLPDGRVLMVDGNQTGAAPFAEAVIFDPATDQWSEAAAPILPRSGAAATLLPDGNVLVSQGGQIQSETYDPSTNTWSLDPTGTLDENNGGHTFLLPDGQVLLAGGSNSTGPSTTAELYPPAVVQAGTATALNLSAATVTYGSEQAEQVSVTVSSAGAPTGTVTVSAGSTTLCTITLASGAGSCTLQDAQLPAGTYQVTGSYSGDANSSPSVSPAQALTVSQADSATALNLSAATTTYGNEQTEQISVMVSSAGAPTGTVTVTAGATTLCTITLASGAGSCTLQATQLTAATYQVTGSYSGDTDASPSTSPAQTLTVRAAPSLAILSPPSKTGPAGTLIQWQGSGLQSGLSVSEFAVSSDGRSYRLGSYTASSGGEISGQYVIPCTAKPQTSWTVELSAPNVLLRDSFTVTTGTVQAECTGIGAGLIPYPIHVGNPLTSPQLSADLSFLETTLQGLSALHLNTAQLLELGAATRSLANCTPAPSWFNVNCGVFLVSAALFLRTVEPAS